MTDERLNQLEKLANSRVPLMRHEVMELINEIKLLRHGLAEEIKFTDWAKQELSRYRTPNTDNMEIKYVHDSSKIKFNPDCVCHETSSRNCPVHQNQGNGGNV